MIKKLIPILTVLSLFVFPLTQVLSSTGKTTSQVDLTKANTRVTELEKANAERNTLITKTKAENEKLLNENKAGEEKVKKIDAMLEKIRKTLTDVTFFLYTAKDDQSTMSANTSLLKTLSNIEKLNDIKEGVKENIAVNTRKIKRNKSILEGKDVDNRTAKSEIDKIKKAIGLTKVKIEKVNKAIAELNTLNSEAETFISQNK